MRNQVRIGKKKYKKSGAKWGGGVPTTPRASFYTRGAKLGIWDRPPRRKYNVFWINYFLEFQSKHLSIFSPPGNPDFLTEIKTPHFPKIWCFSDIMRKFRNCLNLRKLLENPKENYINMKGRYFEFLSNHLSIFFFPPPASQNWISVMTDIIYWRYDLLVFIVKQG